MSDHLEAVEAYEPILRNAVETADDKSSTAVQLWSRTADAIRQLVAETRQLREATKPVPAELGDISDIPLSLREELAAVKTDELEDQIYTIVKASSGGAGLDTILIELYRRFGVEQTRRFIQNKSYRMSKRKIIYSVSGRKGFYTATEQLASELGKPDLDPGSNSPPETIAIPRPSDDEREDEAPA